MSILNGYPYTDFHEINLDFVLDQTIQMKELGKRLDQTVTDLVQNVEDFENAVTDQVDGLSQDFSNLSTFVDNYFDNLDVQNEINTKLDQMAQDGDLGDIILATDAIPAAVSEWLEDNITPTTPAIDATLTIQGAAADAKAAGDRITTVETLANTVRAESNGYREAIGENIYNAPVQPEPLEPGGINTTTGRNTGPSSNNTRCRTGFINVYSSVEITCGLADYWMTAWFYSAAAENRPTHVAKYAPAVGPADVSIFGIYERDRDKYLRVSFYRKDGAALTTDITDPNSDYSKLTAALKISCVDPDVKYYYDTEMESTITDVRNCQTEPCLVMPLVTDVHYASAKTTADYPGADPYLFLNDTLQNIKAFTDAVKCDGVICLGDLHDGGAYGSTVPSSPEDAVIVGSMLLNNFRSIDLPFYFTYGNHDDCRYFSNTWMNMDQVYKTYMSQTDKGNTLVFDSGYHYLNYYKDFPQLNTRLIEISTNYAPINQAGRFAIPQATADFLTSALNTMDSAWTAIIITHAPIIDNLIPPGETLVSFSSRAVNAITAAGKKAIVITGHTHYDVSTVDPFLHVTTAANKNSLRDTDNLEITTRGSEKGKVYVRQLNSGSKDLWDVVVLKPFSGVLDFVRFGSGVNRRYHISPVGDGTLTSTLDGAVTWASSNTTIAVVNNGAVTGIDSGRCAITATDTAGNYETWIFDNQ